MENVKCSVCGEDLVTVERTIQFKGNFPQEAGIEFDLNDGGKCEERIEGMFGETKFTICYCCVLKALGVKPIKELK